MSFFKNLKKAFSKIVGNKKVEDFEIEDILIESDFGVDLSSKIAKDLKKHDDINIGLKQIIESILKDYIKSIEIDTSKKPYIITVCGVNGSGKTTTIAKIAKLLKDKNLTVDIAACDTFRAAATEQLTKWADKLKCKVFKADSPKDPASVAFEAVQNCSSDVLLIDTAGRLHNNQNLMNELSKIYRVISKLKNSSADMNILVIDATIGQNSIEQVLGFNKIHPISGVIISKMDGKSKGGTIIRIVNDFKMPILGIGTGESENDFEDFSIHKFLEDLV